MILQDKISIFTGQIFYTHPCSALYDLKSWGIPPLANEFCLVRRFDWQSHMWLIWDVFVRVLLIVDKYFMGVTCFLLFNVFAMCGSLIAAFVELVNNNISLFASVIKHHCSHYTILLTNVYPLWKNCTLLSNICLKKWNWLLCIKFQTIFVFYT